MTELFRNIISVTGYAIEAIGVIIIIIGSLLATIRALKKSGNDADKFLTYKRELGRSMLLGLEFLVAGDIIRTVIVDHSIESIMALGMIVLIRTVLVFTIHLEVEGHWPWNPPHPKA